MQLVEDRSRIFSGFDVKSDHVGTGIDEVAHIAIRFIDHQVHIQESVGGLTQGFDHRCTDGQIGNEVPVHDIDMDPVCSRTDDVFHVPGQATEIGREDAGSQTSGCGLIGSGIDPVCLPARGEIREGDRRIGGHADPSRVTPVTLKAS